MDIIKENTGDLEAIIKVKIAEEDYSEQLAKELKKMQKQAQMPGFRPGKVPMGLVKKMYGKNLLAEEVNKMAADAVIDYIEKEDLHVLGNPLPDVKSAKDLDWDTDKEFELHYQVGLSPDIDLELTDEIEVDYHKIMIDDAMLDQNIADIRKRQGQIINPGVAEADDVLAGEFAELDENNQPVEGGVVNKTNVFIPYIKDEDVKKQLVGAKPGTEVVMEVMKAVENETEAASMLGIKKEELANHGPSYRFIVESINRVAPAEMDETLFDKIAPGKEIKTEEAFREFIREQISLQYQADVDKHFSNIVSERLIDITDLPLPEQFLKNWLLQNNSEEMTEQLVEDEFDKASNSFRWQLLANHLQKKYELEVKPEEINKQLEYFIRTQLAQYGQSEIPQEIIDKYVQELSGKKEEVKKVYDHLMEGKLLSLFKEKLSLNEIEVSLDDFNKLITEKYKTANNESEETETNKE